MPVDLPTWALDSSIRSGAYYQDGSDTSPGTFSPDNHDAGDLVSSIGDLPPRVRFSSDLSRLYTVGVHLGTISASSRDLFYDLEGDATKSERFLAS